MWERNIVMAEAEIAWCERTARRIESMGEAWLTLNEARSSLEVAEPSKRGLDVEVKFD